MTGVELATIAAYASIASAAVGVVGAISSGQQASAANKRNARIAENDAIAVKNSTEFEAAEQRKRTVALLSQSQAAVGASGVTMEGSPLLAQSQLAADAELDALAIQYSGSVAEARARSQAAADRAAASGSRRAGYFGAGTSLLKGVGAAAKLDWSSPATSSGHPSAYYEKAVGD